MTDYLTLTEFVPGTKAKAQEVNANFAALKTAVNSKAVMNGDSTQLFNVATATGDTHAINKAQLTQLSNEINVELKRAGVKFCARSGNITSGKGDLFSYSGLVITPKIGGAFTNLVIADYKGLQATISSAATLSMTGKANGTYNIFVTPAGALYVLANNIYKQATRPTLVDGDVWLDTSKVPFNCIKYTNSSDVEFLDVPLGKVVIASSVITLLETFAFNQNGFEVNTATFTQSLATNGWTKLPNGLIMQWGQATLVSGVFALTYPIAFPTATLHVNSAHVNTGTGGTLQNAVSSITAAGVTFKTSTAYNNLFYWTAVGY